ncbi:MAG: hypothetical protein KKD44_27445 [Proteobacteria bacterium]|nr:hypothetical protein [Pseudomonadota bacterium]
MIRIDYKLRRGIMKWAFFAIALFMFPVMEFIFKITLNTTLFGTPIQLKYVVGVVSALGFYWLNNNTA